MSTPLHGLQKRSVVLKNRSECGCVNTGCRRGAVRQRAIKEPLGINRALLLIQELELRKRDLLWLVRFSLGLKLPQPLLSIRS